MQEGVDRDGHEGICVIKCLTDPVSWSNENHVSGEVYVEGSAQVVMDSRRTRCTTLG